MANEVKNVTSTESMRLFLIDQMKKVAKGEQTTGEAKAICYYAQQIHNTKAIELRHAELSAKYANFDAKPLDYKS